MNKVLVTGANGFIGRKLLNALDVDVLLTSRSPIQNKKSIVCDFTKDEFPENLLEGIDTIFHLAGFAHDTRTSKQDHNAYRTINVQATVKLANLAVKVGVENFIFISSVKAGGASQKDECSNEEDQNIPQEIYGLTKREAELALLDIEKNSQMSVVIIRPSLVYGPGVKGNLKLMLNGVEKGWFPPLPKVINKKSMIHIDDLIRAILFLKNEPRSSGNIYIVTDGINYSTDDIYRIICEVKGKSIPNWSVPKVIFDLISLLSPKFKYKFNKLISNDCYKSNKIEELGFKAKKTLKEINETDF